MHPAPSIIIFTTLSGLGYGLAAMLGLGLLDPSAVATKIAHVLALAMISGGLLASTLHLGNPQRAWRALSQWRSSWLSREGVMALATFAPLALSAWFAVVEGRYMPAIGIVGALMCAVTVYCTGMIYASLRSIQGWNTQATPLCYLLFAAAGGFVLATAFAAIAGSSTVVPAILGIVTVIAAWFAKHIWWIRLRTLSPLSTPETATGLGGIGRVKLFERPHINDNYLTREMGFKVARKHALKLSKLAMTSGGAVPILLLVVAMLSGAGAVAVTASVLAVAFYALGVVTERWLFFAEAKHAVMNYY